MLATSSRKLRPWNLIAGGGGGGEAVDKSDSRWQRAARLHLLSFSA